MADMMQQRRDTAANWTSVNPILGAGQVAYVTDTKPWKSKTGDGVTHWNDLPYNQQAGTTATKTIIACLGDSITAGYPYTDNSPADSADTSSWTNYLRQTLNVEVHNKGIGGQTTTQLLARFDTDVLGLATKPTHCIIMGGINDGYKTEYGITLAQSQANIIEMISRCTANDIVPIIGIFTPTTLCTYGTTEINAKVDAIRSWLLTYCPANGIATIDFYGQFFDNVGNAIIQSLLTSDLLHPNTEGYKIMGRIAVYAMKKVLGLPQSVADYFITKYASGTSPRTTWEKGTVVIEGSPAIGSPAFWQCLAAGSPGTWGASGYVRSTKGMAPNRSFFVGTTDTNDYYWEVGDIVWYLASATSLVMYEVTAAGYSTSHAVPAERATFATRATIPLGGGTSQQMIFQDSMSSPDLNTYYPAGAIVFYPDATSGNGCSFQAISGGYNANSSNTPHATWVELAKR